MSFQKVVKEVICEMPTYWQQLYQIELPSHDFVTSVVLIHAWRSIRKKKTPNKDHESFMHGEISQVTAPVDFIKLY